jgi:hypothetical protein
VGILMAGVSDRITVRCGLRIADGLGGGRLKCYRRGVHGKHVAVEIALHTMLHGPIPQAHASNGVMG